MRLGLYTRCSELVGGDDALERQDEDGYEFADEHGATIEKVYQEKKSAWKKKTIVLEDGTMISRVIRPDYAELLADLRSGYLDGAIVWDLDRLTRDLRDLEDAIEVVELYGRPIVGPGVDLTTEYGKANARAQAVAANKASADTSRRVRRSHKHRAERGVPVGGSRPFGWKDDKRTLDLAEAAILREGARRILAGVPVVDLVHEWNDAGVRGTRGKKWTKSSVLKVYRNPRICGLRGRGVEEPNINGHVAKYMQVVTRKERTPDGRTVEVPVKGQWKAIIGVRRWEQVIAKIGDRTYAQQGHNSRRYLLSGVVACGRCGRSMFGSPPYRERKHAIYRCPAPTQGGCGKVSRHGPHTEDHILSALFNKIELETADAVTDVAPWEGEAALAEVKESIIETRAAWTSTPRRISPKDYFPTMEELREREEALLKERNDHLVATANANARPADVRAEWDDYTLARQRAIIKEHLIAVVVHPAGKGRRFDPELLDPVWREET
ncbi:recombinase family protein [Parafrankia sp. FMc6]|uniref:recombinase family protein n=1 Tax=Parafrankia soli TaxID=2599596 RepID=UPI0034D778C2